MKNPQALRKWITTNRPPNEMQKPFLYERRKNDQNDWSNQRYRAAGGIHLKLYNDIGHIVHASQSIVVQNKKRIRSFRCVPATERRIFIPYLPRTTQRRPLVFNHIMEKVFPMVWMDSRHVIRRKRRKSLLFQKHNRKSNQPKSSMGTIPMLWPIGIRVQS